MNVESAASDGGGHVVMLSPLTFGSMAPTWEGNSVDFFVVIAAARTKSRRLLGWVGDVS